MSILQKHIDVHVKSIHKQTQNYHKNTNKTNFLTKTQQNFISQPNLTITTV